MPRRRGVRFLTVGEDRFLWNIGHQHEEVDDPSKYAHCREIVVIRRHRSRGRLEIVFRAGPGRLVPDGMVESGAVMGGAGRWLNLHEPGTVRALLDEALDGGWRPDRPDPVELDGWALFDTVFARRGAPTA
ncbi:hypothetical protein GCM10010112_26970 [Actinoplanes lobatus]|uniref:Uncharacterized protein n=1 Tax=Actinoplanes lobatus TaxID=113568 RepID=A0A7W7HJM6_9ACTN|nr:hypothetical protein [Actinoplanes lobatus]MBB4751739.1 hypothetical protein [Actinoplanes lobatus]GGN65533.1 hypothetical protein GCM10010112_26970 [Actinoplanes lobatus]GIE43321.1 hypothetical protein Alo02nite_62190 [Actinoplanes lobatus]